MIFSVLQNCRRLDLLLKVRFVKIEIVLDQKYLQLFHKNTSDNPLKSKLKFDKKTFFCKQSNSLEESASDSAQAQIIIHCF